MKEGHFVREFYKLTQFKEENKATDKQMKSKKKRTNKHCEGKREENVEEGMGFKQYLKKHLTIYICVGVCVCLSIQTLTNCCME